MKKINWKQVFKNILCLGLNVLYKWLRSKDKNNNGIIEENE